MAILLRTFAADQNTAASAFLSIAKPVGVVDGDLLVAVIVLPAANMTVTPPNPSWTLVVQSDPTRDLSVAVFQKVALNEPVRWVFALSSSVQATGGMLCFGNCDGWEPVEAYAVALTAANASQKVPAIAMSLDGEEVVRILGAKGNGTFAVGTGYQEATHHATTNSSFSAQYRGPASAGEEASTTSAFSGGAVDGACVAIVLRPSVGQFSVDDVRGLLIDGMPDGFEDWADTEPGGDYYNLFQAIAEVMKTGIFDLIDGVRLEIAPHLSRYKLADWERLFGLETSRIAKLGTIPQRQAQVLAYWRAAASDEGITESVVQAVVAVQLGFDAPSQIRIIRADRGALRTAHSRPVRSYVPISIPNGATTSVYFNVLDSRHVSAAGARLSLYIDHTAIEQLSFALYTPDGNSVATWSAGYLGSGVSNPADERRLYVVAPFTPPLRVPIIGEWRLDITSLAGADGTLQNAKLFVEGSGRDIAGNDGLAACAHRWGVFVDPTLVNHGAGGAVDYAALDALLRRFERCHVQASIIREAGALSPAKTYPGNSNCIPGQVVPNS